MLHRAVLTHGDYPTLILEGMAIVIGQKKAPDTAVSSVFVDYLFDRFRSTETGFVPAEMEGLQSRRDGAEGWTRYPVVEKARAMTRAWPPAQSKVGDSGRCANLAAPRNACFKNSQTGSKRFPSRNRHE
jgi:hypothetical protein